MYPTLEEVRAIAAGGDYRRVPVCCELMADRFTPVEVMRTLRSASCHCFLLESAEQGGAWGRYSFLGCNPTLELTCTNGTLRIREGREGAPLRETVEETDHPGRAIRAVLESCKSPQVPGMPPLAGGLVGYFSYDYVKYAEPRLRAGELADRDFRDVDLMLFDQVIAFDHARQKLLVVGGVRTDDPEGLEASYERAHAALQDTVALLESGAKAYFPPLRLREPLVPRFSQKEYGEMVERAKRYIREGDIFQVVLSNPLTAAAEGSLFDAYRVLRTTNPSPYLFYFSSDDV